MTTETILPDEEIVTIGRHARAIEPGEGGYILPIAFARAIEQAVLQSPEVQAWKRDSELFKLLLDFYWFQSAFDRFDPADGGNQDKFESECRRILGAAQGQGGRDDT